MKWPLLLSLALLAVSGVLTYGWRRNGRGGQSLVAWYIVVAAVILLLGLRFGWLLFFIPIALFPFRNPFSSPSTPPEDRRFLP